MSFIGTYKIAQINAPEVTEDGFKFVWATPEEYVAMGDQNDPQEIAEREQMGNALLKVDEDGNCYTMIEIPKDIAQEELDDALAHGARIVDEKYIIVDEGTPWEMRGDDFYTRSGVDGELFNEKTDPWVKSNVDENTIILGNLIEIKYTRM